MFFLNFVPNEGNCISLILDFSREKFGECFTTTSEITNDYLTDTRSFLDRLRSMNISQRVIIVIKVPYLQLILD